MLTIRVMRNGAGYAQRHLEQNDYYAEGERVKGQWLGEGAEKLGLNGTVLLEQFERVRQGLHPETGDKLRQRRSPANAQDEKVHARSLYDMTFSAPKSVSIMAILGKDDRLLEAHDRAVKTALMEVERHAATRVRAKGQEADRVTRNLIVAAYRHDSSRRLDPQLHTHCVAANMTWDAEEQKWKALQAGGIYARAHYATEIYRNFLSHELHKLGYEIQNRSYGFEIKGVPQPLIEQFSRGSRERDAAVAQFTRKHGREPTANEIAVLVRDTRPDKLIHISTTEVRQQQFSRLSVDDARTLADIRGQADKKPSQVKTHSPEQSLQYALDHVFERISVARDFDVLTAALVHGRGQVEFTELKQALKDLEIKGAIIRAGDEIATHASLNREREMIEMVNTRQGGMERLGKEPKDFLLSPSLTAEQRNVVMFALDSKDRAVNIQGAAGAGKTATLGELRRALQENGRMVWAVAPTASAVNELRKVGFLDAQTVERLLLDTDVHAYLPKTAIVVDEAGMLSARQMHELLRLTERYDARLVFCGDTRQIQPVEAGDALRILEKESRLATIGLGEVKRQKNIDYKEAIKTLRADPSRGFDKLDRMGAVKEVPSFDRPERVAEAYRAAGKNALVVCPTHEEIRRVTHAIREGRRERGELAAEKKLERLEPLNWTLAQKRHAANYAPGQVLVFHKGTKEARKHEALTVVTQDGERVTARNHQGREIHLTRKQANCFGVFEKRDIHVAAGDWLSIQANVRDGAYQFTNGERVKVARLNARDSIVLEDGRTIPHNFKQFDHGYAITAHRSQGKTVDEVIISGDRMTRELFYVAASRGRHRITIFTGDKQTLRESIGASGQRMSALELLRSQARTVDRTRRGNRCRSAERPRTPVSLIGKLIEKVWENVPRLVFGERFAPRRDGREMGR
jgi:conjugative relaxase-like TrwC/TraI family protein